MAYTNVGFLKGSQSNLNTLMSNGGAKEGIFYLTEDTHRLYIGHDTGTSIKPVPVNEGIQFVAAFDDLPVYTSQEKTSAPEHAGEFYYLNNSNVLCVWNGSGWVQINPNTNDNTYVASRTLTVSDSNNDATILDRITDSNGSHFDSSLHIVTDTGLNLGADDTTNTITITGDTYTIEASQDNGEESVDLILNSTNQDDSTVVITAGENITLTATNDGFSIAADDTTLNSNSGSLTISPAANSGNGVNVTFSVADTLGNSASDTALLDPTITVGNSTTSTTHFINGDAALPVYTINEINSKFQVLNSMHYIGTLKETGGTAANEITAVDEYHDVTAAGVSVSKNNETVSLHIGDTILIAEETEIGTGTYAKGTLLIANGSEGANGIITAASLYFDVVEESYDTDTTYNLKGTSTGFQLIDSEANKISEVAFTSGTDIDISSVPSGTNNVNDTITINHGSVTRTDTPSTPTSQSQGTNYVKTVVTGIATSAQGHVTGVTTEQMTWTDTNGDINSVAVDEEIIAATLTKPKTEGLIEVSVQAEDYIGNAKTAKSDAFIIASETLAISAYTSDRTSGNSEDKTGLSIELMWGTF